MRGPEQERKCMHPAQCAAPGEMGNETEAHLRVCDSAKAAASGRRRSRSPRIPAQCPACRSLATQQPPATRVAIAQPPRGPGRREAAACRCPPASETQMARHQATNLRPTGRACVRAPRGLHGVVFGNLSVWSSRGLRPTHLLLQFLMKPGDLSFSVLARTGLHRSQANVQSSTFPSM